MVLLKIFFEKVDFVKNKQMTKKMQISCMQRVKVLIILTLIVFGDIGLESEKTAQIGAISII